MEFNNSTPIYLQLADEWRRLIVINSWPPASKVPSVRDLATEYGVNPNTVQRALSELEREGLAQSQRTLGRFITEDEALIQQTKETLTTALIESFVQEVKSLNLDRNSLKRALNEALGRIDEERGESS